MQGVAAPPQSCCRCLAAPARSLASCTCSRARMSDREIRVEACCCPSLVRPHIIETKVYRSIMLQPTNIIGSTHSHFVVLCQ